MPWSGALRELFAKRHRQYECEDATGSSVEPSTPPAPPGFEEYNFDLMTVEPKDLVATAAEKKGLVDFIEATLDSGAEHSVLNPKKHLPGSVVRPSEASRRGLKYQGPGKEVIPNEGEVMEEMITDEGLASATTWQAAQVRKALMAVSGPVDKKNMVIFDHDEEGGSFILSRDNPEMKQIRRLIQQARRKMKVQRKGGTFTVRLWRKPENAPSTGGFPRRGS